MDGRIHFAPGRVDFDCEAGAQRLGHEVAHVLQQRRGNAASNEIAPSHRADLESEAQRAGAAFASGHPFQVSGRAQRQRVWAIRQ